MPTSSEDQLREARILRELFFYFNRHRAVLERETFRMRVELRDAPASDRTAIERGLQAGTQLTLGEHATLVVDEFVYDPSRSRFELSVRIAKGAFLYVGGMIEAEPGAKVRIRTPAAAIGVRGTTVWGGPIDKGFGVLALSGEVTVTGRRGTVTLKQGEGTMLFADGKPRRVVTWPAAKVQRAIATIAFGNPPGGQ